MLADLLVDADVLGERELDIVEVELCVPEGDVVVVLLLLGESELLTETVALGEEAPLLETIDTVVLGDERLEGDGERLELLVDERHDDAVAHGEFEPLGDRV